MLMPGYYLEQNNMHVPTADEMLRYLEAEEIKRLDSEEEAKRYADHNDMMDRIGIHDRAERDAIFKQSEARRAEQRSSIDDAGGYRSMPDVYTPKPVFSSPTSKPTPAPMHVATAEEMLRYLDAEPLNRQIQTFRPIHSLESRAAEAERKKEMERRSAEMNAQRLAQDEANRLAAEAEARRAAEAQQQILPSKPFGPGGSRPPLVATRPGTNPPKPPSKPPPPPNTVPISMRPYVPPTTGRPIQAPRPNPLLNAPNPNKVPLTGRGNKANTKSILDVLKVCGY